MGSAHRTRPLLALVTLLVAVGAPGCGGGDSGPHLTKAQFLKRGNAICAQAKAEQVRRAHGHEKALVNSPQVNDVLPVFLPPMQKELRRLEALNPPQGDEKKIQEMLKWIAWGVKDANSDFLDLYAKRSDPFVRANKEAREYGLDVCAGSSHAVIKPINRFSAYE
jgi:hypothetical protein